MIKPKVSRGNKPKVKTKVRPAVFTGRTTVASPRNEVSKSDIDKLVDLIYADEIKKSGLTKEEFFEKQRLQRKATLKYREEHWVSPLLDGQIFAILTQKETKPYYYMGKPVSKGNEIRIDSYKKSNKGWLEYKKKQSKTKSALEGVHIPPSILQSQKDLQKIMQQIQSSVEPLKKVTEKIKSWNNPIALHMFPFNKGLWTSEEFPEGLLSETRRIRKPDNGLNSYASRHELQNGIEVAKHYLKTHNKPDEVDYAVTAYENAGALADSVGMTPQELFKITADHIKLREKEYKKRIVEMETGYLVEMLVNQYLDERQRHEAKKLGALTMKKFYKSKYVQNFMKRTGLTYDYKRFDEQMRKWLKIYTSKAHKKN